MPDEPELGPGAAPVKVERPGRFQKKEVEPVRAPQAQPQPRPSIRERVGEKYREIQRQRAEAKKPEVRRERIKERKESLALTKEELSVRREERAQRIQKAKESRIGYVATGIYKGAKSLESRVPARRYPSRIPSYHPREAYRAGLTGMGPAQLYGPMRPGISAPSIQPSTSLPIHSMSSIGTGGRVSRFDTGGAERYSVPRGTIKPYWSKKVKSLAKSMVRAHGTEEGIARTRQVASELGWKMQ